MEQKPTDQLQPVDNESLDEPSSEVIAAENPNPIPVGPPPKPPLKKRLINGLFGLNLYLLLFIFVLIVAGVIVLFSVNYSKKKSGTSTVNTTALSQDTLDKLANSDASVGTSSQVLSVQSSAVFAGKVLVRSDLEVAGNLQIGGRLNIANITVTDSAELGQASISRNLSVTGDVAVQGQQTIAKSLQVAGSGTFNGTVSAPIISTSNLQLTGDLVISRHIVAGGGTPNRSNGTAVGAGGSASVSGSDTAGSASINTGGGTSAGCFITVTFTGRYNTAPKILITPVGADAGGIDYYITRTTANFSICTSSPAPTNTNFGFDYFVIG